MMKAFGVEITPLFLAILSSSAAVCGGEPTQKEEEGKKEREERILSRRAAKVFSIPKSATPPI